MVGMNISQQDMFSFPFLHSIYLSAWLAYKLVLLRSAEIIWELKTSKNNNKKDF